MRVSKITGALAIAAVAVSTSAVAGPNWTYVNLDYTVGDNDGGGFLPVADALISDFIALGAGSTEINGAWDDGTDSWGIGGSFAFGSMYHVQLSYSEGSYAEGVFGLIPAGLPITGDADIDDMRGTIGIHPAVTASTDLVAEFYYSSSDIDVQVNAFGGALPEYEVENDEFGINLGLRSQLSDNVDAGVYINYGDNDFFGDEVGILLDGAYSFYDSVALTAGADVGETQSSFSLGLRYDFN
jgi:hypothetical protein